jgi:hypothetical protein
VRALLALVAMCLLAAVRPLPVFERVHAPHTEISSTTSPPDLVPAWRLSIERRCTRHALHAIVAAPPAIPPPSRSGIVERHVLAGRVSDPVVVARCARDPPV